jgi:predicted HicB family RNase H-like nuclease
MKKEIKQDTIFNMKMPKGLHRDIDNIAHQEGVSIAEWVRRAINEKIQRDRIKK